MTTTEPRLESRPRHVGERWIDVCGLDDLQPDRGAAVLVNGHGVALFRVTGFDEVFAVDHVDPATRSLTIARGLVGSSADGDPIVAAPLHKQRFDLRTGMCLDDDRLSLAVWSSEVVAGRVRVAAIG